MKCIVKCLNWFFLFVCLSCTLLTVYVAYNMAYKGCMRKGCVQGTSTTAFVESDKIFNESLAFRDMLQQIMERKDKLQQALNKELEECAVPKAELDLLSEEAKKEKIEQFNKNATKITSKYRDKASNLENKIKDVEHDILQKIKEIIQNIAESEGIDLVLLVHTHQVLYSKNHMDISDRVLDAINKTMPKLTLGNIE